ncbi:hypothetical protein PoB_000541500 [Plakobranchus ocellatus]|uniref:Uncharacterized protein n=1 Tax=Plakobranchus ocellatus TaxID=259542 RepID=A0AAV3Y8T6_9GAST|nr:hypothetical protein PoB_000541500 [Plakobranchus ocellatus]
MPVRDCDRLRCCRSLSSRTVAGKSNLQEKVCKLQGEPATKEATKNLLYTLNKVISDFRDLRLGWAPIVGLEPATEDP